MIVLDASAALELLLGTPVGERLRHRLLRSTTTLHAPHLIDLEVAQVLRRYVLIGAMTAERGRQALDDLADLGLTRYPHDLLLDRIWELRPQMTAYDAAYVSLAEGLDATLVTRDRRLAASHGHHARIEAV